MKKIALITILILIAVTPCYAKGSAKRAVKKGNTLYDEGKFKESLEHYEKASSADPNSGIVNYNIGAASYKLNDYERAVNFFNRALTDEADEDEDLTQQTSYNLANSEYMYGVSKEEFDLQGAIDQITESIRHYEKALELDKEDKDAIFNYEYVKKELKRLQEKLKDQEKTQPQGDEQKDQKDQGDKQQDQQQKGKDQQDKKKQQQQDKEQQDKQDQDQKNKEGQEDQKDKDQQDKEQQQQDKKDKEGEDGQQDKPQQGEEKSQESQDSDRERNVRGSAESSANGQKGKGNDSQEEMSARQASMLLDNYRHEEEPKGLYKQKIETGHMPDVDKDW